MEVAIVEVLPGIKSCTIYGKTSRNFNEIKKVNVKESEFSFSFVDKSDITIKLPFGITLVPDSGSGYKYDGSSIVMRSQIAEKTTIVQNLFSGLISEFEDFQPYAATRYMHFKPKDILAASCRHCSTLITPYIEFKRTCQLPSINWEQSSEDWFCCLEKPVKDSIKPHSLHPAECECFYAELFYVLNKNHLLNESILIEKKIICPECNFQIGDMNEESFRLWKHSIKWINKKNEPQYYHTESESIVALFDNIDRDNFGVNCRLVLERQSSPKEFIFMVTMDTNMKFLMSPNVFFGNKFKSSHNSDGTEKDKSKEGNSIPIKKLCLNVKDDNSELESYNAVDITLNNYRVIKLLFKHSIGEDSESASWIDDINVHILPCGDRFFDVVLKDLRNSNCLLPRQSNTVDEMLIGYIMRP